MNTEKKSIFEKPILSSKIKSANVKLPEMLFGYLLGPFGGLLLSGILGAQITTYWKYVLFAQEYANSTSQIYHTVTTFTTLLPLISAILIVAGNLVAGQIIEKTKTKAGKARPWILLSSVFLGVSCVLMFIAPTNGSTVLKMVLQAISYNLYYAIAYPLYNTANSTLIPVSTRNGKQRGVLASITNIAGLAVMGVGSMIFPAAISLILHYNSVAWMIAFVAVGIFSFVITVVQYYFTRERVTEETLNLPIANSKVSVGKQLKAVACEKYWWIIIIFYLIFQFSGAIKNASMYDYCNVVLHGYIDAGLMQTILGIVGAIPMAIAILIIYPLANKFNKQIVVGVGLALGVVGGTIAGIWSTNPYVVAVGIALKCFGSSPACYMILAMIADVLDHIEAKRGYRCDGFTMSIYSAIMIAAVPVTVGIYNGLIGAAGFVSSTDGSWIEQPLAVGSVITVSYIWVETVAYAICAVMMIFFSVEKHIKDDQKSIRERQKAEAIANGEEWIEPEERLKREEQLAEEQAEQARIAELKAKCQKKGLSFEQEEAKYQNKKNKKKK
jgi:GPH family glycoside/pentoside/hexuronide:cation symporter